ncbi:MAG: 3-phosphoshikimate 1-carboxyvinyltransferase [Spirochaeta sp. LUC14_002_19_P3]|nr:MAG: 3-phosphoshikimate 1-carboxyvinyltransferase [Spirochaeta sp. LUC14_002_19_P3]
MEKTIRGFQANRPRPKVSGRVNIPPSKSHTIRALLIAAYANGQSRLGSPLVSKDALSCRKAVEALGAQVENDGEDWLVTGFGPVSPATCPHINVGNSGTTLYLTAALAALSAEPVYFDGDSQIRRRTAQPLLAALRTLGAAIEEAPGGCAPFTVRGPLRPGTAEVECPVSQYLSGLLLAAPLIQPEDGKASTKIHIRTLNEAPYVELTLDWLKHQGIAYKQQGWDCFDLPAGQRYTPFERRIPADWSSATFFLCAAAITGGTLTLEGLDINDSQGDKVVLGMLQSMGCEWQAVPGGITFQGRPLRGMEHNLNAVPDALPALAAAACFAEGETRLLNVPQARMKETDRIAVMTSELRKLGAEIEELEDGMVIRGTGGAALKGGTVNGHHDHRVVMALAAAAPACEGGLTITGAEAASITFPGFFECLEEVLNNE